MGYWSRNSSTTPAGESVSISRFCPRSPPIRNIRRRIHFHKHQTMSVPFVCGVAGRHRTLVGPALLMCDWRTQECCPQIRYIFLVGAVRVAGDLLEFGCRYVQPALFIVEDV